MRIGIIGQALDNQYAGIHYFLKNLVKSLTRVNSDHQLFLLRIDNQILFDFTGIETTIVKRAGFRGRMTFIFKDVPKWARENELDVVIEPAHFGPFNLPKRTKRITFIHDLTPIVNHKWQPFLSRVLQRLFLPVIIRRADLILTNSHFTKSQIVQYYKPLESKVVVTHLGISDRFKNQPSQEVMGKYGIHKEYFLYQGTLEPRKNIQILIKAFENFKKKNPKSGIQLILAGKVGWRSRQIVKEKYESIENDDIILLGYVYRDDMPAIYSGAKAFVYPSLYEGFGLPVLEALACGIIVLASNSSSIPEVGGRHAHYFDPDNVNELTKLLQEVSMGNIHQKDGQVLYAKDFTWKKTATEILQTITELDSH